MSKTTALYNAILHFNFTALAQEPNSIRYIPDSPGAFGTPQHFQLLGSHLSVHPFVNDFIGKTDKHMTHSLHVGYHGNLRHGFGFQVRASWNLVTEALKQGQGMDPFPDPVGRSADWVSLSSTFGKVFSSGLFLESGLSVGHAGNKGAHGVQESFHEAIGVSARFRFVDQPEKVTFGAYTAIGVMQKLPMEGRPLLKIQLGYQNQLLVQELFVQAVFTHLNYEYPFALTWKGGYQHNSPLYRDSMSPFRTEFGAYMQFKYMRPGFLYVSHILRDDKRGQLYVELINFQKSL